MIGRGAREWVFGHDLFECLHRLYDDGKFDLQFAANCSGYGRGMTCRCVLDGAEHRVAAIEQRCSIRIAKRSQKRAQFGHGTPLGLANIDTTQQGYEGGHLRRLTFELSGRRLHRALPARRNNDQARSRAQ